MLRTPHVCISRNLWFRADMTALGPDPIACLPRGVNRDEAARYIGVGAAFDEMSPRRRITRVTEIAAKCWLSVPCNSLAAAPEQKPDGMNPASLVSFERSLRDGYLAE
jgi:hypothetical protein